MAIKVSGTTVIDNDRNINVGIVTASTISMPPQPITFSPTDASSDNALDTNIVITYNANIAKNSGNITLRDGSASGTVIETIDVTSGNVTISGGQATINPTSDLSTGKDVYVVVDAGAFKHSRLGTESKLLDTYNFTTGPITTTAFAPSDGATGQSISTNINLYFSESIIKGSGNITIRSGSASGTIQQTIDVTSSGVSTFSGGNSHIATINPPSDLEYDTDTYIVVDAGCFTNTDGDAASGNAIINTYNFTTESDVPPLGGAHEGGYLICCSSSNYWIVAPSSAEVTRDWYNRNDANTKAQQVSGCSGWFVPSTAQIQNPGHQCRTYWDSVSLNYWSNTQHTGFRACHLYMPSGAIHTDRKTVGLPVRAFRCVAY